MPNKETELEEAFRIGMRAMPNRIAGGGLITHRNTREEILERIGTLSDILLHKGYEVEADRIEDALEEITYKQEEPNYAKYD